jgi:hypothetical protein
VDLLLRYSSGFGNFRQLSAHSPTWAIRLSAPIGGFANKLRTLTASQA